MFAEKKAEKTPDVEGIPNPFSKDEKAPKDEKQQGKDGELQSPDSQDQIDSAEKTDKKEEKPVFVFCVIYWSSSTPDCCAISFQKAKSAAWMLPFLAIICLRTSSVTRNL